MKIKIVSLLLAAALLTACGAKRSAQQPQPEGSPEVVVLSAPPADDGSADEASRYGVYSLDGGEQTEESGVYDSDTADENALVAADGAALTVRHADIIKTGDGTKSLFSGLNAAAAAVKGALLTLDDCTLTTNGLGATGLFASGENTKLLVSGSQIVTAGGSSPALVLADGAAAEIKGTRLMSEMADTSLIMARGNASVTLSGCTLQCAGADAVTAQGGLLTLALDGQQLTGDIRLTAAGDTPTSLMLWLRNGAAFTGAIWDDGAEEVGVSLDAGSVWTLTGETTVSALTAPDTTFACIQSNGFSIFYNAEHEANAWLKSQAYALPGGGYLTPMI